MKAFATMFPPSAGWQHLFGPEGQRKLAGGASHRIRSPGQPTPQQGRRNHRGTVPAPFRRPCRGGMIDGVRSRGFRCAPPPANFPRPSGPEHSSGMPGSCRGPSVVSCGQSSVRCRPSVVSCGQSSVRCRPSAVSCAPFAVWCRPSAVWCRPSAVWCGPSAVWCGPSAVSCAPFAMWCWLSAVWCRLPAI